MLSETTRRRSEQTKQEKHQNLKREEDRSTSFERPVMAKVEDEPRVSVQGGCGDGDGGEEHRRVEVAGEGGFSVEKSIHEARYESCV